MGPSKLAAHLHDWDAKRLARGFIRGVMWSEIESAPASLSRIRSELFDPSGLAIPPVPNLMFMRDPCITIGDRVLMSRMATPARARESLIVAFAIRHGRPESKELILFEDEFSARDRSLALEGGDVLILSPEVVMIGCSERTNAYSIQHFAEHALFPPSRSCEPSTR